MVAGQQKQQQRNNINNVNLRPPPRQGSNGVNNNGNGLVPQNTTDFISFLNGNSNSQSNVNSNSTSAFALACSINNACRLEAVKSVLCSC